MAGPTRGSSTISRPITDQGSFSPPSPGRYTYIWTINGQQTTQVMTVRQIAGGSPDPTLAITGSPVGPGTGQTQEWSPTTVALLSSAQGQTACAWHGPLHEYNGPFRIGEQWTTEGSCQEVPVPGQPTVWASMFEKDRVTGRTVTDVDGRQQVAWVIQRARTFTQTSGGASASAESVTSDLFAPGLGLVLLEVSRTVYPQSDGTTEEVTSVARLSS